MFTSTVHSHNDLDVFGFGLFFDSIYLHLHARKVAKLKARIEEQQTQLAAAYAGLAIANKLKDKAQAKAHKSRIFSNINRLRRALIVSRETLENMGV